MRPEAIQNLRATIEMAGVFVNKIKTNMAEAGEEPLYTDLELERVVTMANRLSEWLTDKEKQQGELQPHQDPVLLVKDINDKLEELKLELATLLNKKRPLKSKPKKNETKPEDPAKQDTAKEEITIETKDELPTPREPIIEKATDAKGKSEYGRSTDRPLRNEL